MNAPDREEEEQQPMVMVTPAEGVEKGKVANEGDVKVTIAAAFTSHREDSPIGNVIRMCGLCGGSCDGEPAVDNPTDAVVVDGNAGSQPQDESCPAEGSPESKKADGFGTGKGWLGRLLGPLGEHHVGVAGAWIHENCAIWSPEVYFSGIGRLKNVKAAIRRGRFLRCSRCNQPGATIGCRVDRCPQNYHLPCAREEGSMFNHRKYLMACYDHSYLFRTRRKKRVWYSKSFRGECGDASTTHLNWPRISKAQRRAAASAARLKDIEAEEKYLDKSGEDEEFVRRERKRLVRDLAQIAPVKLGGRSLHGNPGISPQGWDSVAGLQDVVQCLKEMVTLPLLYPDVFQRLGISPPRGVLLHGHPGTGKTLVVRALAGACSRGDQQVAYFARKGADILGKYVGDSERQLRLLFQVAEQCQPAIIFFDEIDGLAPSRCGDRDQTQSSVVSTLLALMDGLSSRGSVVVIGATNRPDSLDPALRRPGRFDREIYFPLPSTADRASILRLHTSTWVPAPSPEILSTVAKATPGFAGADLQSLCVEAAMTALRRVVPLQKILDSAQEGISKTRLPSLPTIKVTAKDWAIALARAPLPCSRRLASTSLTQVPAAPLPRHLVPALLPILVEVLVRLGLDARVSLPPPLSKAYLLIEAALKAARIRNVQNGYIPENGDRIPENWLNLVNECFIQSPTSLGKVLEESLADAGIIAESHGIFHFTRPTSTVLFLSNINARDVEMTIDGHNSTEHMGDLDVVAKQKWQGSNFRVLLLGDAKQGQRFVAGAFVHGFEGLAQTRTLSLPAMLMEGVGDVEQGLISIIGVARRSVPCIMYMPKIEDWVVQREHDAEETNRSPSSDKKPSTLGRSHDAAGRFLSPGTSHTKLKPKEAGVPEVSGAWKLMKQQLQSMPPDTYLMLLATCEAGTGVLPPEVLDFFSPRLARDASSKSPIFPAQVAPCVCAQLPSHHDFKGLLDRASQDIARTLATGFGSRVARLREEFNAGQLEEKPKMNTTGGVRLSTLVQRMIAERVSQLRTRVREDLGRDLRNIGQDWARNLGTGIERTYANDLAKVFGIDVGRGLGIDLEQEIRNLETGLVEEANKEMRNIGVEKDSLRCSLGKSSNADSMTEKENRRGGHNSTDVREGELEMSMNAEDTRITSSLEQSLLFGTVNSNKTQHTDSVRSFQEDCSAHDIYASADTQNHCFPPQVDKDLEQQPETILVGTRREGVSEQPISVNSLENRSSEQKALQCAISFCGYRLLQDRQLTELRNATAGLRSIPTVNIYDNTEVKTFDWENLEFQTSSGHQKDEKVEPEYVGGLIAVGLKAQRGMYQSGREVEFELQRVVTSLYKRVQQKIENGKDSVLYLHLTTEAAALLDLMASWVLEVRKLEIAANMHNVPISKSILEFEVSEEQQEVRDTDLCPSQEQDDSTQFEVVDAEHHPGPVPLAKVEATEDSSEQLKCVDEGTISLQGLKTKCGKGSNVIDQKLEVSGLESFPLKKVGFCDDIPKTVGDFKEQTSTDDKTNRAPGWVRPTYNEYQQGFEGPSVVKSICNQRLLSNGNGVQELQVTDSTIAQEPLDASRELPLLCMGSWRSETISQDKSPVCARNLMEGSMSDASLSRRKAAKQQVRFKSDCLRRLEFVVKEFLDSSCKEQDTDVSVEALHDLVTGCTASALAASQNVLCKSEKTKVAHQVIMQWAGMTCDCGRDKVVESEAGGSLVGVTTRPLSFNCFLNGSSSECTTYSHRRGPRSKKRKKPKVEVTDIQAPPAKRPVSMTHEAPCALLTPSPIGLESPMKQTKSAVLFTCLQPVIRAVLKLITNSIVDKETY